MTQAPRVQLETGVDASGARAGFNEIENAAQRMAAGVQAAGGKAAAGLQPLGAAGEGAGDKIERSTRSIIASIERTTAAMKAGERNTAAYFEVLANQRGANVDALAPYLAQLRQAEVAQRAASTSLDKMGVSAGQTKAALRQLPAQFTDIFTSLQGGQAPLTVLIQQGGQIKDSFGGVRAALAGVASAISPTVLLLGGLAAAVGAGALAYSQGAAEASAYRQALVLTGNAAGTSVGQMQAQAQAVARLVGTQGKAAEVIATLAASGQVAQGELGRLAEAAIRLERVGGPSIAVFAKAMQDLGEDPVKASLKLNESTRYLSVAVLEQIRSLEKQGQAAAAAGVAQSAYADATSARAKELEANLGTVARAWQATGDAALKAWDFFAGIGRAETVQTRLEGVSAELERRRRAVGPNLSARSNDLLEEQSVLQSDARLIKREGDKAAAVARTVQEYEKARVANEKWADAALTNEQKIAREIEANRRNFATVNEGRRSAGLPELDQAALARQEQAIRKSIAGVKQLDETLQASRDAAKEWADGYKELLKIEGDARASTLGLTKAQAELVRIVNSTGWAQASTEAKLLIAAQFQAARAAEDLAQAEKARIKATEDGIAAQRKYLEGLDKSIDQAEKETRSFREQAAAITGGTGARDALIQARLDDAAAQAAQNLQAAEAQGVGEAEYERLSRLADKLVEVAAARRQLAGATADKEAADTNAKAAKDAAKEWDRAIDDVRTGLTNAFRLSFQKGEDFGKSFARNIGNELKARLSTAAAEGLGTLVLQAVGLQGGGAAGGAAGQAGGYAQTLQAAQTLYGYGKSAYGYFAGTTAAGSGLGATAGASASIGGSSAGAILGDSSAVAASQGAGAGSGVALSTWAAAIAAGIYKANQDYSQGFGRQQARDAQGSVLGLDGRYTTEGALANLLDKLGFSDRLTSLLSGSTAVAKIIGRAAPKVEAAGFQGSITGGDFTGSAFRDIVEKGGLLRSDKRTTETTALSEELARYLDAASQGIFSKAKEFAAALGLPAEALAGVSQDIKVALTSDGAKNQEEITKALAGYGDALVKGFADAVKPLALYGETTVQTIDRVGGAIKGANEVLQALGITALQASVDGGKAAIALQELFGGAQGLQQGAGQYLQAFYTDSERAALATASLGRQLAAVGVVLPATRDEFRSLVQAQDLTSDSGRRAFAALMGVAGAFAEIVPAARNAADILAERAGLETELLQLQGNTAELRARELAALDPTNRAIKQMVFALLDQQAASQSASEAARTLSDAWRAAGADALGGVATAFGDVRGQVDSARQRVEQQAASDLQRLQQQADRISATFGDMISSVDAALRNVNASLTGDDGRGQSQQVLQQALQDLRAGRSVDADAIKQAAASVSRLSADSFATRADYQRALAGTGALLRDVNAAARREMSAQINAVAQGQVAIEADRDRQLALLDDQLQQAKTAASALVSIDEGVQTMAEALARLASAIGAAGILSGGNGPTGQLLRSGNTEVYRAAGGAVATRAVGAGAENTLITGRSGAVFTAAEAQAFARDRIDAGDFVGLRARAVAEGIDSDALDLLLGLTRGTSAAKARELGLPAFAAGTAYVPSTGLAHLDQGERVMTVAENAAFTALLQRASQSGGAGEAAAVTESVRAMSDRLFAALAAIAAYTRRSADVHEQWEAVGVPTVPL